MPRKPRIYQPNGFYHVILRGNNRKPIFFEEKDRDRWEAWLARALVRYDAMLHCYCWMTNHVHLLIQIGEQPLSRIVQYAAAQYARSTNRRYNRSGHLFERRHRALLVTDDSYLLGLVRYIHRNPVEAGLAATVNDYRWSSHRSYMGAQKQDWLTIDRILAMFGRTGRQACRRYAAFMQEEEDDPDIYRIGNEDDERILGVDTRPGINEQAKTDQPAGSLEDLIHTHCRLANIIETELTGPGKAQYLVSVRGDIIVEAASNNIATVAELARRLNRSEPAICQMLNRRKTAV